MKLFSPFIITVVFLLLNSCASFDTGYLGDSVDLSADNFSYVKRNIRGEASTNYGLFYLFGGMSKANLVEEAKENMLNKTELKENQSLANISVFWDSDLVVWGFWARTKCVVTADVIEFN